MDPIRLAIKQPITVAVGILLALLAGYLAFTRVPVEMTPEIQRGVISITTIYPNANPADVEADIVQQQEDVLRELSGLERLTSTSTRGQAQIRLELETGTDMDVALREVNQLIREVPSYPPNVLEPVIEASDPESNDYIAWFLVEHEGGSGELDIQTLFDFVDNRVRPRLERINGISQVNVLGGRQREVQVRVDPEKLAQRGMTMPQLVTAIQGANRDFSAGALAEGNYDVAIRMPGRWSSPEEAEQTVLRQDEGGPVYLGDVAEVVETYAERSSFLRNRGEPALAMNFQRELGSNLLSVMADLKAEIARINSEGGLLDQYAQTSGIEGKLRLHQVYDQTGYVEQAISMVRTNLLIGAGLAVFVLLLFLRSLRSVGIIALAIPTSVIGVAIAMVSLGRTINIVSLAGAAFAIGLVVDNSIVVLENIYRHLHMRKSSVRAAYDGASEVALAVMASTLTTVVVFIPVLLIEQQVGQLFRDLAIAICASVLISYVVSMLVIPSAAALLLSRRDLGEEPLPEEIAVDGNTNGNGDATTETNGLAGRLSEAKAIAAAKTRRAVSAVAPREGRLRRGTRRVLGAFGTVPRFIADTTWRVNGSWLLRGGVVGSAMLLVIVGVYVLLPPFDYLPKGNRNIVFGIVVPPPGYNIEQIDRLTGNIEQGAKPYYEAGAKVLEGELSLEAAQEQLPPVPVQDPTARVDQVIPPPLENYFIVGLPSTIFHGAVSLDDQKVVDVPPLFQHITRSGVVPGTFSFAFQAPLFQLGGGSGAAVKIDVVGEDLEEVTNAAGVLFGSLLGAFNNEAQIQPTPSNFNLRGPELQILRDDLRASDVGITDADLGTTVQAYGDGIILRDAYKYPDELRDVVIIAEEAVGQESMADLPEALAATPYGTTVALGDVANFVETQAPTEIRRVGGERAVTIEVTAPDGMPLGTAVNTINLVVENLRSGGAVPPTVNVDVAGTASALNEIQATLLGDGTFIGTLTSSTVLALLTVYLLMCVLFQSWSYPFVIMVTVPLSTFGGFLGLWLVNLWSGYSRYIPTTNLDVLAMLGFIILAGTVVNNAILIVEQALNFLEMDEKKLREAEIEPDRNGRLSPRRAITEGVRSRVRPIFMSMLTSVGGMLPLVLIPGSGTELYRGLGAVVVGGLFVSTIFTLFVTPAMLSLVMDLKQRLGLRLVGGPDDEAETPRPRSAQRSNGEATPAPASREVLA